MKRIKQDPTIDAFAEGQRVRVHLNDGTSVAGVITDVNRHYLDWKEGVTLRQGTGRPRHVLIEDMARVERRT